MTKLQYNISKEWAKCYQLNESVSDCAKKLGMTVSNLLTRKKELENAGCRFPVLRKEKPGTKGLTATEVEALNNMLGKAKKGKK